VTCFRMMYDTRAFGYIWKEVSVRAIDGMMKRGIQSSKIINRDDLVQRFVDFYELSIPAFVQYFIRVSSSIVMLFVLIGPKAWIIGLLAFLALLSGYVFSVLNKKMDVVRAEAYDDKYEAIQKNHTNGVRAAYNEIVRSYVKRSDYSAWRWVFGDALGLVSTIVVVLVFSVAKPTPGTIMAAVTYGWTLFESINGVGEFLVDVKEIETAKEKLAEVDA